MTLGNRVSLQKYVEGLKQRLADGTVPTKHAGKEKAYKQMLEIDLKKTLTKLAGE